MSSDTINRAGSSVATRLRESAPTFTSLALGALFWELVGRVANFRFFPPLTSVLDRLGELLLQDTRLWEALASSLSNLAIGLVFSIVVGLPVGLLMGMSKRIEQALDIYVNAMLTAPALIFAPVFFAIWGLSRWSIVALIVQYAMFIMIISAADAVRSVDVSLIEMARMFNASRRKVVTRVIVPAAMPLVFAGLRLGTGRAVKGMINGEMFIAAVGLGALITGAGRRFDAETVLALLIVVVGIAAVLATMVQSVDRRMTAWVPKAERGG